MHTEANKTLVRRFYEEVMNTGIVDNIKEFISPEYTELHDGKRLVMGIEGSKKHIIGVRQTYPDLHITIEQQIAEDDWVVSCITAQGTHKGLWLGIRPTHKPVTFTGSILIGWLMASLSNTEVLRICSARYWILGQ